MSKSYEVRIKHYPEDVPEHFEEILIVEKSVKNFHSTNCVLVLYPSQSQKGVEDKYKEDYFELKHTLSSHMSHPGSSRGDFYYINLTEMYSALYDKDMFEPSPLLDLAHSIVKKNRDETQSS